MNCQWLLSENICKANSRKITTEALKEQNEVASRGPRAVHTNVPLLILTKVPTTDRTGGATSKVYIRQLFALTLYLRVGYAESITDVLSCHRFKYCLTGQATYSQGLFPASHQGARPY